ncbi:SRPBCC family protein [Actinokineospora sp. PR83]|uniref:SRPBCC family protein n=1 Tax=Actinokineospora sp. PR83 TaxID=2884908 RepID=UPI001F4039F8|nr:SRPBCC family protein [Actinokineospora sp. PR83]MCG8915523.1 SRPBCC family protein [Actinokineospora sp. PR83]
MARQHGYVIRRKYTAPPERVFAVLADAAHWSTWARPVIMTSRWAEGTGEVGSVRVAGMWPVLIRERITELHPPSRLAYRMVGRNIPVRDYEAAVEFRPAADGGTELTWTASFRPVVPGTGALMTAVVKSTVLFLAWRLGPAAARGQVGAERRG